MRSHERKFPRVKSAKQLKPIYTRTFQTSPFPMGTEIVLDRKRGVSRKIHQLVWLTGATFGSVGDQCSYISHDELFELQEKCFIELSYV